MTDDPAPLPPAELASVLRPSLLRLTRTMRNQRVDESVTLTLLAALMTLEKYGPMSPGELAAHERVQPPSMTKILAKLEEKGLVRRTPHATDRRQVVVAATEAGRTLLAEERQERDAWLSTRLAMITPAERELLARVAPLLDRIGAL